jgi:Sodium:neurotransmitter symporter family
MTGRPPSPFFTLSWAVTAPALILLIWIFTLLDHVAPTFGAGAYHYPLWALAAGWALTSLSLAALPVAALQEVVGTKRKGSLLQV